MKGSVAVIACNEWSPNQDTRNNVRYYGKNMVWYQTTYQHHLFRVKMSMPISLVDEFGTPGGESTYSTSGNSEKKSIHGREKMFTICIFTPHETKSNIHICRVCSRERSCDIKRSYGNLYQKHIMTDPASTYEQEMDNNMKSTQMGKTINTHFEPALNKRAADIYS